jgi:Transposase
VNWAGIAEIEILGLDEIALKKGHRDYVTLVTGRLSDGEIMILGVVGGHEKAEVIEFLRLIPLRIVQTIQTVCCDLWEAYTEAARQELPTARIVADRFHVAKHYRQAADELRKQELHRLKKELSKEEYQKLNGSFRAFRKNAKDMNKAERKILKRFFEHSASAKQAYLLREQLTAIFNLNLSKKQAQSKIRCWVRKVQKSGLPCFDDFLKLLNTCGRKLQTTLSSERIAALWKASTTRSKSSSGVVMAFSTLNICFSVSFWTCMVIAYLLPPLYMSKSRQFPKSLIFFLLPNSRQTRRTIWSGVSVNGFSWLRLKSLLRRICFVILPVATRSRNLKAWKFVITNFALSNSGNKSEGIISCCL